MVFFLFWMNSSFGAKKKLILLLLTSSKSRNFYFRKKSHYFVEFIIIFLPAPKKKLFWVKCETYTAYVNKQPKLSLYIHYLMPIYIWFKLRLFARKVNRKASHYIYAMHLRILTTTTTTTLLCRQIFEDLFYFAKFID